MHKHYNVSVLHDLQYRYETLQQGGPGDAYAFYVEFWWRNDATVADKVWRTGGGAVAKQGQPTRQGTGLVCAAIYERQS